MSDAQTEPINKVQDTKNKRNLLRWLLAIAVVVIFVSILAYFLVTLVFSSTKPVTQRASSFANYLVKNDSTNAYAIASKGFKIGTDQNQLKLYFEQLNQALGNGNTKLLEKEVLKEKTVSYGSVTFLISKNQKDYYLLVQLIKEDGVWKVHNFQTSQNKLVPNTL